MANEHTVLVIDDHFEILEMLRSLLQLASPGCRVLAVPSAEEALLELGQMPIDLVICDVQLPGMNGLEFVRRARQRQPGTPLIMMSAYASAERTQEANGLGVVRFFPKPLDMEALLAIVHDVLRITPTAVTGTEAEHDDLTPLARQLRTLHELTRADGVALTGHGRILETSGSVGETPDPTLLNPPPDGSLRIALTEAGTWCTTAVTPDHLLLVRNPAPAVPSGELFTALAAAAAGLLSLLPAEETGPAAEPQPETAVDATPESPADPALTALLDDTPSDSDADDFWQAALAADPSEQSSGLSGLSYEEARARGLLPPDWS